MNEKLNNDNFVRFAMNNYDNPQCHSVDEFDEDLKRFLYLKKLFSRYRNSNELREKLIINHSSHFPTSFVCRRPKLISFLKYFLSLD